MRFILPILLAVFFVGFLTVGFVREESAYTPEPQGTMEETVSIDESPVSAPAPVNTPAPSSHNEATLPEKKSFSLAEVAAHASAESCYAVVRGQVYNLTSWIARHPGGERSILSMCGTDATDAFVNQHGGKGGPEAALASFRIGVLE